jgi:hypothetical protein
VPHGSPPRALYQLGPHVDIIPVGSQDAAGRKPEILAPGEPRLGPQRAHKLIADRGTEVHCGRVRRGFEGGPQNVKCYHHQQFVMVLRDIHWNEPVGVDHIPRWAWESGAGSKPTLDTLRPMVSTKV